VAYLIIKALRRGKGADAPVYGFDIFQVWQDQVTGEEPTIKYHCGELEDGEIKVIEAEMGLEENDGEPFTIELQDIRDAIAELDIPFVLAQTHEM
jgi:hypothetical protein